MTIYDKKSGGDRIRSILTAFFFTDLPARREALERVKKFTPEVQIERARIVAERKLRAKENDFEPVETHLPIHQRPGFELLGLSPQDISRPAVQIIAAAGLGKTTIVVEELSKLPAGWVVWFMEPTREMARELIGALGLKSNLEVRHVIGRNEENCIRHKLVKAVVDAGLSVKQSICDAGVGKRCPNYSFCPFVANSYENWEVEVNPEKVTVIVCATNYLVSPIEAPAPDLVIVDERHFDRFYQKRQIHINDMVDLRLRSASVDKVFHQLAAGLKAALFAKPDRYLTELRTTHAQQLKWLVSILQELKKLLPEATETKLNPAEPDHVLQSALSSGSAYRLVRDAILMVKTLRKELSAGTAGRAFTIYNNQKVWVHTRAGVTKKIHPLKTGILVIDASADQSINERIWGEGLRSETIEVPRNAQVRQVNKSFSSYSLVRDDLPDGTVLLQMMARVLVNLAKEYELLFVASNKKVRLLLERWQKETKLPSNILFGHFNALRGSNAFKDCTAGVVIGRILPPIHEVENYTRAFFYDSESPLNLPHVYEKRRVEIQLKDGTAKEVETQMHPDPKAQAFLRQFRECENEQAADRLRLIHNVETKPLYLFCNTPLALKPDQVLSWTQMAKGGTKIDLAGMQTSSIKVFPCSGSEMARLFPRVWANRDEANGSLNRAGGKERVALLISNLYWNGDTYKFYRYKLDKKGARWNVCAISDEVDAKSHVEQWIGKTADLVEANLISLDLGADIILEELFRRSLD